jgi:hypothetical protein
VCIINYLFVEVVADSCLAIQTPVAGSAQSLVVRFRVHEVFSNLLTYVYLAALSQTLKIKVSNFRNLRQEQEAYINLLIPTLHWQTLEADSCTDCLW